MSKFIDLIYNRYIKRYQQILLIVGLILIFIIASYYGYKQFYSKKQEVKKYDDIPNTNTRKQTADVFFFYVDWCPHCKTAKPIWNQFKEKYNNTVVNDYLITCNELNCTDDASPNIADAIAKYKIDSYPTIKMTINSKQYEFDTKISFNALKEFVNVTTKSQNKA
jgi:thiol-disulfide isomerase/thioredoxin|uniref:Thioredoxin domain-containing protein n=1 Tax=viral metagenome TaxID=1070528 RepID=A0A6C0ES89_9ZZZZ